MSSQLSFEPAVDCAKLEERPTGAVSEDGPALDVEAAAYDVEGPAFVPEEPKVKKPQCHQRELA
jgi:hypothetical protein